MIKLLFLFFFILLQGSDIILPPNTATGQEIALILLPGSGLTASEYQGTLSRLQGFADDSSLKLWVGILSSSESSANLNTDVPNLLANMTSQGFKVSGKNVFYGAHSPKEGLLMQDYAVNQTSNAGGLILFGGFLNRFARNNLEIPTLSLFGELDGVCTVTRCGAEEFYHQTKKDLKSLKTFPDSFLTHAVVVIHGSSHMSFADGKPSDFLNQYDLQPEVSYFQAQTVIDAVINAFLSYQIQSDSSSKSTLENYYQITADFLEPILTVMEMSGNQRLREACNSDYPTNTACQYPKYPDASIPPGPHPAPNPPLSSDCMCGSAWVEQNGQRIMSNFTNSEKTFVKVSAKDAFHDVSDTHPFHLPHIFNKCNDSATQCTLNTTSVTFPIYKDVEDNGRSSIAAFEFRTKLKSRQATWQAVGIDAPDVDKTDGSLKICRTINQESLNYALNLVGSDVLSRYGSKGEQLVMVDDVVAKIGITGPQWIKDEMVYKRINTGSSTISVSTEMTVQSWTFKTKNYNNGDVPYIITAGYHYCKILSPFKALEWVYVDSLRQYNSLGNTTNISKSILYN